MRAVLALVLAAILLLVAAFCALGFLATFEPPGWPVLRVAYAAAGVAALLGAGRLIFLARRKPRGFPTEPRQDK